MLAPDVRFGGFTYQDWQRVVELFQPRRLGGQPRDPARPKGLVVALHQHGTLRKLLHSEVGRLRLDDLVDDWPVSTRELAHRHNASFAISLEVGALDAVMEGLGERCQRHDDMTTQWLSFLGLMQSQLHLGRIQLWPHRLEGIPMPTTSMIDRTLDSVVPPGNTMLFGLFDGDELWTCLAAKRGLQGFERIVGPDELRPALGLLSGDHRRDHRHLVHVVRDYLGPVSFGCFSRPQTFRQLQVDPRPGAWARAVAIRDVVLYPVPAAMALPLGVDAGRAAFGALRRMGFDAAGALTPALNVFREMALGNRKVEEILGFNPLEILRALLARER